jgi:hypothetical protein
MKQTSDLVLLAFRDAFSEAFGPLSGADVYYAGKAFLCAAWPGGCTPTGCA